MDDEWKEYRVHDTNSDEQEDDEIGDRDFIFKMFQSSKDEDTEIEEFTFPQFEHVIKLRGTPEITNSTGLGLWRGSEVLASYLANQGQELVKDKCVLELGAGQGLCGLVAHHLGASRVLLTDGDTNVLDNLRYNVNNNTSEMSRNEYKISCPQLIWGRDVQDFLKANNGGMKLQILLAADVNYMASSLNPFWKTVSDLLEPVTGFLIYVNVSASQCSLETNLSVANNYGLEWEKLALDVYKVYLKQQQP